MQGWQCPLRVLPAPGGRALGPALLGEGAWVPLGAGAQPGAPPAAPCCLQPSRMQAAAVFRTPLLGRAPVGLWVCVAEAGAPQHLRPAPRPSTAMRDCIPFPNRFPFSLCAGISCQDRVLLALRALVVPLPEGRTGLASPAAADPLCPGRVPKALPVVPSAEPSPCVGHGETHPR